MTKYQSIEYGKLRRAGAVPTLRDDTRIAVNALQEGGASLKQARLITAASLRELRNKGVQLGTKTNGWKR